MHHFTAASFAIKLTGEDEVSKAAETLIHYQMKVCGNRG